ncbi:MAG: tail fiber domain-containing protein [Candidatus Marinimicrobia bacterium]|nr:tail fiber domain-containing protein [Candidatus Neomarinimicrobiota bacterium]
MSIQGVIRDDTGASIHGSYNIEFRLYDAATGGTLKWNETQTLTVTNGVYSALLGSVNSLSGLNYDISYWLGIAIDDAEELIPRTKLTMSPYAMMAGMDGITNIFPQDGDVGIGTMYPTAALQVAGDIYLGWNDCIGVAGTDPAWQNKALAWTWSEGIGDHLDFYVPGDNNPTTALMKLDQNGKLALTNSLITIPTGTLLSNFRTMTDGFRMRYDDNLFGSNLDGLVIEKTDGNAAYPDGGIIFANTGNDDVVDVSMAIRGDGKIGVGTIDPTHTLDVRGPIRNDYNATYDVWLQGGSATSGEARNLAVLGHKAYDKLYLNYGTEYANGTIIGGNVGIGTSAPVEKLHVVGDTYITNKLFVGENLYQRVDGTSQGWHKIDDDDGNDDAQWYETTYTPSDRRLKTAIETIPNALEKIAQLRGVYYQWSEEGFGRFTKHIDEDYSSGPETTESENEQVKDFYRDKIHQRMGGQQVGVIAQEIQEVMPELVQEQEDGYLEVSYGNMVALLIEGMKEQQSQIETLQARLDLLENSQNR